MALPVIGIVGFGTFGQFVANRLVQAGYRVIATSRTPYQEDAAALGVDFYQSTDDFCEASPDVVLLATSILSTDKVLASLPLHKFGEPPLFVDVLSVKDYPKALLQALLPPECDVLCTHPMFGPVSGAESWKDLTFMYDAVRVADRPYNQHRLASFLEFWRREGCRMVEMTCEEHDRQAASTQFITHTVGRMLGVMEVNKTDIDTKGYDGLLQLVNNTANDSFDLYYGLFLYNQNASQELERLERALGQVKKMLQDKQQEAARAQLMQASEVAPAWFDPRLYTRSSRLTASQDASEMSPSPAAALQNNIVRFCRVPSSTEPAAAEAGNTPHHRFNNVTPAACQAAPCSTAAISSSSRKGGIPSSQQQLSVARSATVALRRLCHPAGHRSSAAAPQRSRLWGRLGPFC